GDDEDEEEEAAELPTMGFGDDEDEEEEAAELPMMGFGDDEDEEEEAAESPVATFGEEESAEARTGDAGEEHEQVEEGPADAELEVASDVEEAVEEAAAETAPEPTVEPEAPTPPAEQPASSSDGDYVDLGAMILGGGAGGEKSTRFQVAYQEPSGDEEADFAKMLSQFKEKVSENLDSGDVRAHYDLGTAYKEMGLLEEAISSFQQALRASADHLPTYEQMGQTFLEMGQPEAAVRTLERSLKSKSSVEDDFVGIYYYLARAFEALDNKPSALEYYDRVFALDINFADVTERLRALR
ncbi:MAG: tetratricopeptide repeat protein, partial [Gemmatimonadota bacterium]